MLVKLVWSHYLCDFISGVPFDSEEDFREDLRDAHAVVPADKKTGN